MSSEQALRAYVERLAEYLARRLHVDADEILGQSRKQPAAEARMLIMLKLRDQGIGLETIGAAVNRDHSTVHHAVFLMARRLRYAPELAEVYSGMPAMGERYFTDSDLLDYYAKLRTALAEATYWRDRIDAHLAQQSVPTRMRVVS